MRIPSRTLETDVRKLTVYRVCSCRSSQLTSTNRWKWQGLMTSVCSELYRWSRYPLWEQCRIAGYVDSETFRYWQQKYMLYPNLVGYTALNCGLMLRKVLVRLFNTPLLFKGHYNVYIEHIAGATKAPPHFRNQPQKRWKSSPHLRACGYAI